MTFSQSSCPFYLCFVNGQCGSIAGRTRGLPGSLDSSGGGRMRVVHMLPVRLRLAVMDY